MSPPDPVFLVREHKKLRVRNLAASMALMLPMGTVLSSSALADVQIADVTDTLDNAVRGPLLINESTDPYFDLFVADRGQYDNNLFRLPTGADVKEIVGPSASREDHFNSASAGLDGQWVLGRQIFGVQLQAADNRYAQNSNLNNVSSIDKAVWNWGVASVLSGQVGAGYTRALPGFVNALVYERDVYQQTQYFAAARYQVGPRWALYGGILDTNFTLENAATKFNDYNRKAVDVGAELETSAQDSFGVDYRYSDTRYPNSIVVSPTSFNPDYKEDRLRFLAKAVLTEKTTVDASAGVLKRTYANSLIGSFSGPIWRGALGWQPTLKTQLIATVWRDLQAYFTDTTNYYRTTGVNLAPTWTPSEKISLRITVSHEDQHYIGSSNNAADLASRQDTVNSQIFSMTYTPIRSLIFDVSFGHEQRDSNQPQHAYNDGLASVGVKFFISQ
jgi:exopolysaccharide biosynthesis operon protein EpsL